MKLHYRNIFFALIAVLLFFCAPALAQDTLVVEWETTPGTFDPLKNALWNAIVGDTNGSGERLNANRVYKLKKGGFYWLEERIVNDGWHLRLVGETPGNTIGENPAVIQMVTRTSDGTVDGRMITVLGDLTLKNLWITGRDDNGVQTYYQPIQVDVSNSKIVVDNCIFEYSNFALIAVTGQNNRIWFINNKYRNLIGQPSTQQWEGRGMSIWADQDTLIVENNTFFNVEFTPFQMEGGAAKYLRFNHNTIVNMGRNINAGNWFREAYFANNLIVNGFWHGEGWTDFQNPSRDPRSTYSGIFSIGPLPSKYGPEAGRRILFSKTAIWNDPFFATKYGDTIRHQYITNRVTREDFLDKLDDQNQKAYPQMKAFDTTWLSVKPNFATYPSAGMLDSMWVNITELRAGVTPARPYFFQPTEFPTDISWPLPENFSYTTPASLLTAGSDGLPLGDLNWFPTQKAQFEANKAQYITDMEWLAGSRIVYEAKGEAESEDGTLGGTAAVQDFSGFTYFNMDGGGFFQWNFDMASAGQVDLNVWTHMRGNDTRGQRTFINGTSVHDAAWNWGELIYSNAATGPNGANPHAGMPLNEWTWVKWSADMIIAAEQSAFTLNAGANTLRIESSWGYQNFAGVDVLQAGTSTVLASLRPTNANSYDIVTIQAEGAPWVPSKFKSVALGANGNVTVNMNADAAGNYKLQLFYQNYSGASTGQLQVDGGSAVNIAFANDADSAGLDVLSGTFALTAGSHSFKVTGSNVRIDYVKLLKEEIQNPPTSVDGKEGVPYIFALDQNYPNPFNPTTTINFSLAKATNVKLDVFNVLGQKVATLVNNQVMAAGPQSLRFNASRLASGVYFYRLEAGSFVSSKKMLLLK